MKGDILRILGAALSCPQTCQKKELAADLGPIWEALIVDTSDLQVLNEAAVALLTVSRGSFHLVNIPSWTVPSNDLP